MCYFLIKKINQLRNHDITTQEKVLFIQKFSRWKPFFKHFNWAPKWMLHHDLRLLGIFYEVTEEIRHLQVKLIKSLISEITTQCKYNRNSVKCMGISCALNDIKILINKSLLKELFSEIYNMAIELLIVLSLWEKTLNEVMIIGPITCIVKLIQNRKISPDEQYIKVSVDYLLKAIVQHKSKFEYPKLEIILLSIKELFELNVLKYDDHTGIDVAISLLPYLIPNIKHFDKREISLILVLISFFVHASVLEKRCNFDETEMLLLSCIPKKSSGFSCNEVVNIFYSSSILLDTCLIESTELLCTQAIASLIPSLEEKIDSQAIASWTPSLEEKIDSYDSVNVAILIKSIAEMINNNINFKSKLRNIFEKLIGIAFKKRYQLNMHYSISQLWGIGLIAEHMDLNAESIDSINELYFSTVSLTEENTLCLTFNHINHLMWSFGNLMQHKIIREASREPSLTSFINNPFKALLDSKEKIDIELSIKILKNTSRVLFFIPTFQVEFVNKFLDKCMDTLLGNENKLTTVNACKIISDIGKLIRSGGNWTKSIDKLVNTLLDRLIQKGIKEMEEVDHNVILPMFDSIAVIGLKLKNLKYLLHEIIQSNILSTLKDQKSKSWMLSSFTYFYSWYDEGEPLKHDLRKVMIYLIQQIENTLQIDETDEFEYAIKTMTCAKFWLNIAHDNVNIKYDVSISSIQKNLIDNLRNLYVDYRIDSEISLHGMPPVDMVFPEFMLIIEANGPQHYLDKDSVLNGKYFSKSKACIKMGYMIIHVPTTELYTRENEIFPLLCEKIDAHISWYKARSKFSLSCIEA